MVPSYMAKREPIEDAALPMQVVGPALITGPVIDGEEVPIPLATLEAPLWPSVHRGARLSVSAGGIQAVMVDERMSRSVVLEAPDADQAVRFVHGLDPGDAGLRAACEAGSRYAEFLDLHHQVAGNLVFLRLEMKTGDAAGHNMVTAAAERMINWLLERHPALRYVSISGNYCTDKKPSAVNGILGRGRSVVTELRVPGDLCRRMLHTSPGAIAALNQKKNLVGGILAGSLRSANAHFANMLLAFYLATGQDAANIVEGSQGIVLAEEREGGLVFSCTIPHIVVGTVGAGKDLGWVRRNLERLGCTADREPGENARRLAAVCAAAVTCGELSLLAAQTNPGELMDAHTRLERG